MAKYCGECGYVIPEETYPGSGIYEDKVRTKLHYGDFFKDSFNVNSPDKIIPDLKINSRISLLATPFATANFQYLRYAKYKGVPWAITSVDIEYPRINITLGGIYNGPTN